MTPQTAPSRLENLRSLKAANVDMAFALAFITLTTGAFLVGFAKSLGASDLYVNILGAIPALVGILQIPGAIWGRGYMSFKAFIFPGGLGWRVLFLPIIALPLAPFPPEVKLLLLAVCVGLASICATLVNPTYNDWLAEMVPSNSRGYYFSRRNAIGTAVGAAVGFGGALLMDSFRARGDQELGFTLVYALGILCSFISFAAFLRMKDVPRPHVIRQPVREGVRAIGAPFRDVRFRAVLVFLCLAVVSQTLAGNLFSAFALQTLKLDYAVLQGAVVSHAIGMVLSARMWGYLADKYGNKPVLMVGTALIALNPIPWILCDPARPVQNAVLLIVAHLFMGISWSAVGLCQFNITLATAKPEDRGNYLGASLAVATVVGGIAPVIGGVMVETLKAFMAHEWAYKWVFASLIVLRIATLGLLSRVEESGASGLRQTLRELRGVTPKGIRAIRKLSEANPAERLSAIRSVGEDRMALAADEIIKALHDPQPRVRRQAAAALTRLRDPKSTVHLLHMLDEHPDLVEEETVEALGEIGDRAAVSALERAVSSPRAGIRRAAAKALGRIAAPDAAGVLRSAASQQDDIDLRRAALQALRAIGMQGNTPVPAFQDAVIDALTSPHPSVRIAAAEAIADLGIMTARDALRDTLARFTDEASAEVAYALGAVGELQDVKVILAEAAQSRSVITRRRCLLGVARLLNVESEAYRLMLLEDMARDTAIEQALATGRHTHADIKVALERFAAGDEADALKRLAAGSRDEVLAAIAENPVAEAFLVAGLHAAKMNTR